MFSFHSLSAQEWFTLFHLKNYQLYCFYLFNLMQDWNFLFGIFYFKFVKFDSSIYLISCNWIFFVCGFSFLVCSKTVWCLLVGKNFLGCTSLVEWLGFGAHSPFKIQERADTLIKTKHGLKPIMISFVV